MFSDFGKKLTGESGILQLMEDLGAPLPKGKKICALGGGNPAQIPELEKMYRAEMELIMKDDRAFEDLIGKYDGPQGKNAFINSVATFFSKNLGWNVKPENIAVCNGSQSACFYLFNLLSGTFTSPDGKKLKRKFYFRLCRNMLDMRTRELKMRLLKAFLHALKNTATTLLNILLTLKNLKNALTRTVALQPFV